MNRHLFWMIIGCIVPLLLIFLAPSFGLDNSITFFLFIVVMFGAHLMMLRSHGNHDQDDNH
jgi:cell division protein FtsW (lipid II flippase)